MFKLLRGAVWHLWIPSSFWSLAATTHSVLEVGAPNNAHFLDLRVREGRGPDFQLQLCILSEWRLEGAVEDTFNQQGKPLRNLFFFLPTVWNWVSPLWDNRILYAGVWSWVPQVLEAQAKWLPFELITGNQILRRNRLLGSTGGRSVFTITLCLGVVAAVNLVEPQQGTRNSLIPSHLPPSGGHFSAKRGQQARYKAKKEETIQVNWEGRGPEAGGPQDPRHTQLSYLQQPGFEFPV